MVRDSIVGYRATIAGTAIVDGATVRGAVLDGVVIGDDAYVGPGNELLKGLRRLAGHAARADLGSFLHRRIAI